MAKRQKKYTTRFELRCSQDEIDAWKRGAKEHGLPLARYIRACLNRGPCLTRKLHTDPALLRQIAAIGNNLNQITHWANTNKSEYEARLVEEGVKAVRQKLEALLTREVENAD